MPVVKKRRTHHGKSARIHHQVQLQQQQQLQAKQRFENSRLKPESISTISHDESDTILFRSHLLKNFIESSELIDVLTTQLVPIDKIKPPKIFEGISIEQSELKLRAQKESLSQLQNTLNEFNWSLSEKSKSLKGMISSVELDLQDPDEILNRYESEFKIRSQENYIVCHRDKFTCLQKDQSCAPDGYWTNYAKMKSEDKERKLRLQWEQEQEVQRREQEKRAQLEEEQLRKKEEERRQFEQEQEERERQQQKEDLQRQQQEQQEETQQEQQGDSEGHPQCEDSQQDVQSLDNPSKAQVPQSQQNSNQNMMDGLFGDFSNEPFNNGFEDEFGDIDTAFF